MLQWRSDTLTRVRVAGAFRRESSVRGKRRRRWSRIVTSLWPDVAMLKLFDLTPPSAFGFEDGRCPTACELYVTAAMERQHEGYESWSRDLDPLTTRSE